MENNKRLEYCNIIEKIAPELEKEIKEKKTIIVPQKYFVKKIGSKFEKTSVYWKVRHCLFGKGIIMTYAKNNHEPTFIIRARTAADGLPEKLE